MLSETRQKLIGEKSPNWRGGAYSTSLICAECTKGFIAHKKRKYCSRACMYSNSERRRKISSTRVKNGKAYTSEIDRVIGRKFTEYKAAAQRRNIAFDFTKEEFQALILGNCNYCGSEIALGIDRLDSLKGYEKSNSVPCCTKCNFAKSTMTVDEFKEHITLIYYNFINKIL